MKHAIALFLLSISSGLGMIQAADPDAAQRAHDARIVFALSRLPGVDPSARPEWKAALLRHLERLQGSPEYLELVGRFQLRDAAPELLRLARESPDTNVSVGAARVLLQLEQRAVLEAALKGTDDVQTSKLIEVLGLAGDPRVNELLKPLVTGSDRTLRERAAAVTALGRNVPGQRWLVSLVERGELASELQFAAANALLTSRDEQVRAQAGKHLKLPAAKDAEPLPPLAELVKATGDSSRGRQVFANQGTCAKCHKVRGEGKEVGPDLSEIGSKLSREGLLVSILDPNAGISHSFETYVINTADGNVISGLLVSDTPEAVTLKTAEAVLQTVPRSKIDELIKQPVSLMPANIPQLMTRQELVDVVEYLTTLKKQGS